MTLAALRRSCRIIIIIIMFIDCCFCYYVILDSLGTCGAYTVHLAQKGLSYRHGHICITMKNLLELNSVVICIMYKLSISYQDDNSIIMAAEIRSKRMNSDSPG